MSVQLLGLLQLLVLLVASISADAHRRTLLPRLGDHANYDYIAYRVRDDDAAGPEPHVRRRERLFPRGDLVAQKLQMALASALEKKHDIRDADSAVHFIGHVGELADYFQLAVPKNANIEASAALDYLRRLEDVSWSEIQIPARRLEKRGFVAVSQSDARHLFNITDPEFSSQWHLINESRGQEGNDHNVTAAWAQGNFGKGSVVCFVDDGLDYKSEDLKDNYFAEGSYDYNTHTDDPLPKLFADRHGTRCAGEVAAVRNGVCGVGVAYHAQVSAVRILGDSLTEADEAASINYKMDDNHIYSCSWGPRDDGMTMEAPPQIVADAVLNGATSGRKGLGSIFVFASGNGGGNEDNCNFDGYTNSIYTITVSAIDRENKHPTYSESCSANLIVMYSSATSRHDDAIVYWKLGGEGVLCTKNHGGTSAAAPLASGIYALVNSIRPDLNWRDYQHISIRSAVPISTNNPSWFKTAAGRLYSHEFGYGKLDAYQILEVARNWVSVRPQTSFQSSLLIPQGSGAIPQGSGQDIRVPFVVTEEALAEMKFGTLEHVTVTVNIDHMRRGDVAVDLISPNSVVSHLAVGRRLDAAKSGFTNWTFMTVAHWDENPVGTWQVVVRDEQKPDFTGIFKNARITFWGSQANAVENKPQVTAGPASTESTESFSPESSENVIATSESISANETAISSDYGSGFGSGWVTAVVVLGIFGTVGYVGYSRRMEISEKLQSWQNQRELNNQDVEFHQLRTEVEGDDEDFDELDGIEGPSEAELEELRRGGYLVDDLLDLDTTQQQSL
ncbi:pheromone processing endoprotease [Entophlyctis sp. JEL0112]|nr:pheromone processing endoprotease [Entophlyctis sp. JEL0112]